MNEDQLSLTLPPEIVFTKDSLIRYLIIQNNNMQKLVFKIRTNQKSALSINVTHDFIGPKAKKEIPVKLLEYKEGVKLQINYAKPTPEMIERNDAKMNDIKKENIKKSIVLINAKELLELKPKQSNDLETSFKSVSVPEQTTTQTIELKMEPKQESTNFVKSKTSVMQVLHPVIQHPDEDDDELQERKKKIELELMYINEKLASTQNNIADLKEKNQKESKQNSVISVGLLTGAIVANLIVGALLKYLIMG